MATGDDGWLFVLVAGWPGAGKSTLAAALARELDLALLAKDELKESFGSGLGYPQSVERSRWQGQLAVRMMLRAAAGCPGAVLDSTWFDYARPLVEELPGRVVEVVCQLPLELAKSRYRRRISQRSGVHVDALRSEDELWPVPFRPLGIGPMVEVDTSSEVDPGPVAELVRAAALGSGPFA